MACEYENGNSNSVSEFLVPQFVLPHSRGSSHGQACIIRRAYDEDYYTTWWRSAISSGLSWRKRPTSSCTGEYLKKSIRSVSIGGSSVRRTLWKLYTRTLRFVTFNLFHQCSSSNSIWVSYRWMTFSLPRTSLNRPRQLPACLWMWNKDFSSQ